MALTTWTSTNAYIYDVDQFDIDTLRPLGAISHNRDLLCVSLDTLDGDMEAFSILARYVEPDDWDELVNEVADITLLTESPMSWRTNE